MTLYEVAEKCSRSVRDSNKAFRLLKRAHSYDRLVAVRRVQAVVKRTIRQARREGWQRLRNVIQLQ